MTCPNDRPYEYGRGDLVDVTDLWESSKCGFMEELVPSMSKALCLIPGPDKQRTMEQCSFVMCSCSSRGQYRAVGGLFPAPH